METLWKTGALADVQPNGKISQEVGEEKAAHPGRLYKAELGAVGAGDE